LTEISKNIPIAPHDEAPNDNEQNSESKGPKLDRFVKVLLIASIITVTGAIIYTNTQPEEPDIVFFLLNENLEAKDYPSNITQGTTVEFYFHIINNLGTQTEFQVRVYVGTNDTKINSQTGVSNASPLINISKTLNNGDEWTSNKLNHSFNIVGKNQPIVLELWKKTNGQWQYIPDYILFIRMSVSA
jgi:uncharacterized membrane protein